MKGGHDSLVGSREGHLVLDGCLEVLPPLSDLAELEVTDCHVNVENTSFVFVTTRITFLEELLIHLDRFVPIFRAFRGMAPHEEGFGVIKVDTLGFVVDAGIVSVFLITLFERLRCLIEKAELELTISLVIPKPTKARSNESRSAIIEGTGRSLQKGVGLIPLTRTHSGERLAG